MKRALRNLALCALAFSVFDVWYSLTAPDNYQATYSIAPQLLRTTNMALGLATAVVALVAAAQARRWRRVAGFAFLAVLTPYGAYLVDEFSLLTPALNPFYEAAGLRIFMLSYAVPAIATTLVILAGDMLSSAARPHVSYVSTAPDDSLEIHYSSLDG